MMPSGAAPPTAATNGAAVTLPPARVLEGGSVFEWPHIAGPDEEDDNAHVSNIAYVRWIQDAARAHSDAVGWDRAAFLRLGGIFVVKRHEVDYRRPCHAGDGVIVTTALAQMRPASSVRLTRVVRHKDGAEILAARTEWVFVSWGEHRPLRIPHEVLVSFGVADRVRRGRPRE